MKTNSICILIIACVLGFTFGTTFALPSINTQDSKAGHSELTKMSLDIKRNLSESDSNGLKNALGGTNPTTIEAFKNFLSSANVSEDGKDGMYGALHFYDPTTECGYLCIFPNAKDRANDFYRKAVGDYCVGKANNDPNAIKKAWADLGHALHLLQDMTTPAHTNNLSHITGDSFENYVLKNWDHWETDNVVLRYEYDSFNESWVPIYGPLPNDAKIIKSFDANGLVYYTGLKDYINSYLNQYDKNIDQLSDPLSYIDLLSAISHNSPIDKSHVDWNEPISWAQRRGIAENLLPDALLYGAGLINTFWDKVKNLNEADSLECVKYFFPTPGDDHPDDRFDVSDGFYLEDTFDLPFEKQVEMNLRTGIKKGKGGLVYYKQAVDIYNAGVNAITDAEKLAADNKLNELGKITVPNAKYIQSDFKTAPDVAIFAYGFNDAMTSLLLKQKEPVTFAGTDFTPTIVKDQPVMIIPSGGLYGMETSTFFKASLNEYVKNGGTLIVFAQQHGYEFIYNYTSGGII